MKKVLFLLLIGIFFIGCRGEIPISSGILEPIMQKTQTCYRFDKENFQSSKDIIINTTSIDTEFGVVGMELGNVKNNYYEHLYECDVDNSNFQCSKADSVESFQIKIEDDKAYLHVDYLQISKNSSSILYRLKSKDSSFTKGVKTSCYSSLKPIIEVEDLKKGSKKEKLLQSINLDDVVIYDLDYYKDFVVAVGEDNSPQTRAEQYMRYSYASLIIISKDGGRTWEKVQQEQGKYYNKVLILDSNRVVVTSFIDEVGGMVEMSSDGGVHWKNVLKNKNHRVHGDIFISLKRLDNEITATRETGKILKSLDGGKKWSAVKKDSEKIGFSKDADELAVLAIPEYRVDYQTNNLVVLHQKKFCKCDEFSLSLTYNQSNIRRGVLGLYWSFGIENHIDIKSEKEIVFFDAKRGEEKLYVRDKSNKKLFFNNGTSNIKQIKNGYVKKCGKSKQYYNQEGYLIKIQYEKNSYIVHYKNSKLYKIEKLIKGISHPYISFDYSYEGVSVSFDDGKRIIVTFVQDRQGLLSSVIDGNKYRYKYTYSKSKLTLIENLSSPFLDKTVLKFTKNSVYDFRHSFEGIIKEENYLHYDKSKEHICFVNTLTMNTKKELIKDVKSEMNLYYFSYYDKDKKRLLSTQHKNHIFGFDELGRINHYANSKKDIFVVYSKFNKVLKSLIYKEGSLYKYKYTYTNDSEHKLETIISPEGSVELLYDEYHNVKEMKLDNYYIKYEYHKSDKPTKIILVGNGEINTFYNKKGEIESVKYIPFKNGISSYDMAQKISKITELLLQRASAGSIQKYPYWLL